MSKEKMIVATTFNQEGYRIYGKKWIESVAENWPIDTDVRLYVDFEIPNLPDNFKLISFKKTFPKHDELISQIKNYYANGNDKQNTIGRNTIKFSYKSMVIENETRNKKGLFIWLDGDVTTISKIQSEKEFYDLLQDKFMACQVEKQNHKYPHIESGILIVNNSNQHSKDFNKNFLNYYSDIEKLSSLKKPYDGYVIGKVLRENKLDFVDLNGFRSVETKLSDKDKTFQHPFLKSRFVHNIGNSKG